MALAPGTRLGAYDIVALIGSGGMGEVYRARDSRLNRDVAIKVLPADVAADHDRLARFEREAQVLASLNHPSIANIYGVDDSSGTPALVMELVEGPTLADRIAKGPIPLDETLPIAKQIAEALEAAHEQGIIHRDLKPANIKVRADGTVKVLDFGLAKALEPTTAVAGNVSASPTITSPAMTRVGVILGTASYMAPEQAKGKPADKRSDIWAFGCVLYEMLIGRRAFGGDDVSDALASVLKTDPNWAALPTATPAPIRTLLRRCLTKDSRQRLQAIGDARTVLEEPVAEEPAFRRASFSSWITLGGWGVAVLAVTAALAFGLLYARKPGGETPEIRFSLLPPENATFALQSPAVSPDGRRLAVVVSSGGHDSIWMREMDSTAFRPVPGTDDARWPFWSPDNRFLAFFAGGTLKKVDVSVPSAPLPPVTVCECPTNVIGGSWGKGNRILFTQGFGAGPVVSIPATGGAPTPVTSLQPGELFDAGPWFLPDGRHFLFLAVKSSPDGSVAYFGDVESKTQHATLLVGNGSPVFAPPGYVLFTRARILMAQPFDGTAGRTMGDPVAIVPDQVASAGPALLSVSHNGGVLVYVSGTTGLGTASHQLTWFDKSGKARETVGEPGLQQNPAISPDGTKVAFGRGETDAPGRSDIWLHDLARGHTSRFTLPNSSTRSTPTIGSLRGLSIPVWSSDGQYIAFFSRGPRSGGSIIYKRATSGRAQDEVLDDDNRVKRLVDWSHDGRYLVEESLDPQAGGYKIWVKPLFGDGKPYPYLNTQFREIDAKLSPDGQWLAYVSDESKRNEVYVTTFPNPGTRVPISISGGDRPVWSRDGKFLYFIGADRTMMAVDMKPQDKSGYGTPTPLFDVRIHPQSSFDVAKDGRFLIPVPVGQDSATTINVVINWQARLKK